jgi:DNA (cytosine-5)-methyltransferase 1
MDFNKENIMKPTTYTLDEVKKSSARNLFNVVSLFAGGGGSSLGYRLAGGKVLGINEFIPTAQDAYERNFPETHIFRQDVRELTGEMILKQFDLKQGELDILDGSPPCSSFSTAGLREKGWGRIKKYSDSAQRTDDLFFEFVRVLDEVKPKVFVAENVKGITLGGAADLLGSPQLDLFGFHPKTIFHSLESAGYTVRFKVITAKQYGVPQSRARTIFIGVRNDILEANPDIFIEYHKGFEDIVTLRDAFADLEHTAEDLAECNIDKYAIGEELKKLDLGEQSDKYFSLIKLHPDKYAGTLTQSAGNISAASIAHWDDRKLTVKEAIRVMGFPDDYYLGENYKDKIERLGRAVTPPMYKYVIGHIHETILSKIK